MPRIARFYFLLAQTVAMAGCGAIRSQTTTLGSDVIGSVREKEPELFEIERTLADSLGSFMGRAVEDKVLTKASGTWDTMLLKMNEQSKVMVGQLAQGVERDLNRSLQVMLSENMDLASRNAGPLVDTLMSHLQQGMRDKLQPVLVDILKQATDSAKRNLREIDSLIGGGTIVKQGTTALYIALAALAVIVIGGGFAWRRKTVRAQQALKLALASAAPVQLEHAQQDLRSKGFGREADWLK
jgi:hypothetical protein